MAKIQEVSLREYVHQILKNAVYETDNSLGKIPCVVAEAPDLSGCFTQGENFEEARENLIDAIELWITAGLQDGEQMPIINNCRLAVSSVQLDNQRKSKQEETIG
ncbi:type II toxin-antitoxin system HicB family antitoxin [candidate division KSB1 bacterium]|nr:type II toxin-antitoxin system HicB family antitoxin [candidate division KSB1 bacterium]NIR73065.1 type II toxin-antitoxin system HicB family antitoxin [candidate division KSB1 bacterium]NIS28306.1 type II toxin-antitoxin system HicB family antitoxin [candidate division KSB1 bacterium]NIT75175.1 type II toxin-antitoxin system HicB family antitoxin [candidate division KSB1 bacterium]NIU29012.1 type II toxin-antitoxin system HicB family antitoxin [candidate division KSB1 bacterium]